MVRRIVFVCLLALVIGTGVRAETLEHPESGLKFDVPKGWEHSTEGDLLLATNPADDVVLIVLVATDETSKDFIDHLTKELDHLVKKPKVTKGPTTEKINNLTQSYVEGTGELLDTDKWIPKGEKSGQTVDWDVTLVLGGKKPMVVVAFGKLADNQKTIDAVYRSISKLASVWTGKWTGTWENSMNEKGKDSLVLNEDADGTISGLWSSDAIKVTGKSIDAKTANLSAKTAKRDYQITATLDNGSLTLKYAVKKLDVKGSYDGTSILLRAATGGTGTKADAGASDAEYVKRLTADGGQWIDDQFGVKYTFLEKTVSIKSGATTTNAKWEIKNGEFLLTLEGSTTPTKYKIKEISAKVLSYVEQGNNPITCTFTKAK